MGRQDSLPTAIVFPTEGCWRVTGTVGAARLTLVTMVLKASSYSLVSKFYERPGHMCPVSDVDSSAVATILLVGVDLFFRGKLDVLLDGHRLHDPGQRRSARPRDRRPSARGCGRGGRDVPGHPHPRVHPRAPTLRASERLRKRVWTASWCAPRFAEQAPQQWKRLVPGARRRDYVVAEPCIDVKDRPVSTSAQSTASTCLRPDAVIDRRSASTAAPAGPSALLKPFPRGRAFRRNGSRS